VKTLVEFEKTHGAPKLKRLERELEVERQKVREVKKKRNPVVIKSGNDLRFGVVSDPHYGSLYHFEEGMRGLYKFFESEGVHTVLCAGDILDGHRVYRGQEFELAHIGIAAQIKAFAETAPKIDGITTRFITGNHDLSFKVLAGVDVGAALAEARPDYIYEGPETAVMRFVTDNGAYDVMLQHPGGGTSYALSYRPQKIVEQLEGGTKPNMLILGHYHKAEMIPSYRNISVIQAGTMQRQTPFMKRQGLAAHIGGWVVDVRVGDSYNGVKAEFLALY
jgi:UDP-2,3-diacylglucosamine pyrophosphatase LpxH